jgi:predicted PurR-regulated permease PerM
VQSEAIMQTDRTDLWTLGLALGVLILVLWAGLLPALRGGFLVFHLIELGARYLGRVGVIPTTGRLILLTLVALLSIGLSVYGLIGFASYITDGPESFSVLLQKMADAVDVGRDNLPAWMQVYLPDSFAEWRVAIAEWLRENASRFTAIGQEAGALFANLIFGMIIGGMIAVSPGLQDTTPPLSRALAERIGLFSAAFHRIVFSQLQISLLNTFFTGIFLTVILPLLGSPLPLTRVMIVVTFLTGLLPIIGNLISNTVIVLIALSVSPIAALGALIFLVLLHKLEYFLNAHIIGSNIRAKSWELLLAMLLMKALFGLAGVIAAPIYYAYLKDELRQQGLI